jgi:hypothetical protein
MAKQRYEIVIENHSLSEYDFNTVKYAMGSKSAKNAIKRADFLLKEDKLGRINLTYYGRQFLSGLAIAAEADLYVD